VLADGVLIARVCARVWDYLFKKIFQMLSSINYLAPLDTIIFCLFLSSGCSDFPFSAGS
jgi:hypothetical protein